MISFCIKSYPLITSDDKYFLCLLANLYVSVNCLLMPIDCPLITLGWGWCFLVIE